MLVFTVNMVKLYSWIIKIVIPETENSMDRKCTIKTPKIATTAIVFATMGVIWLLGFTGPVRAETQKTLF